MSEREQIASLIDRLPEYKYRIVIAYLQGILDSSDIPNDTTLASMDELDNGGGFSFSGSTSDLFR